MSSQGRRKDQTLPDTEQRTPQLEDSSSRTTRDLENVTKSGHSSLRCPTAPSS